MSGKKGSSGGARKGAGRPKKEKVISEDVIKNYQQAAKELAEEYGESIEKAGLRLIFKDGVQDSVKVAALKEYGQVLVSKENDRRLRTENSESEMPIKPSIVSKEEMNAYRLLKPRWDELSRAVVILPETLPDPAKTIPQKPEPQKVISIEERKK